MIQAHATEAVQCSTISSVLQEPQAPKCQTSVVRFVNLGCGSRYHPGWLNIDTWSSPSAAIMRHDLGLGIPLPNASVEVVYHSHILEHFTREAGTKLLQECFRVLKRGGIIRVAVPDLETIARFYLGALEASLQGSQQRQHNYDWMMLEMYDQAVREVPGGNVAEYFRRPSIPNPEFVIERTGVVGQRLMQSLNGNVKALHLKRQAPVRRIVNALKKPSLFISRIREAALRMCLSKHDYRSLQIGRFRQSGEVHQWMYDRYSLSRCLGEIGFVRMRKCTAFESSITGWQDFHLDTEPDGTVYKPDSLYMEAVKD